MFGSTGNETHDYQVTNADRTRRKLDLFAAASNDATWEWSAEEGLLCSEHFSFLYGAMTGSSIHSWLNVIHPEDRDGVAERFRGTLANKSELLIQECRAIRSRGGVAHILSRVAIAYVDNGAPVYMFGSMRDLSAADMAEHERDGLMRLLEASADSFISVDRRGTVRTWSRGAEQLYGFKAEEIVGRALSTLFPDGRDEGFEIARVHAQTGEDLRSFSTLRITRKHEVKPVSITLSLLRDEKGVPVGWLEVARDLTSAKTIEQLEERLTHAQKLESMGKLADAVAHDINNLLMIISGNMEILLSKLAPKSKLVNPVREVTKATEKGADLIRRLLDFGHQQLIETADCDVNVLVAEMIQIADALIGKRIRVVFRPATQSWRIQADSGQIARVLLNLFLNARDAMPTGGVLAIEVKNVFVSEHVLYKASSTLRSGPYVLIFVSDTGVGMSEETRSRIFERFFTTKAGKGYGLGLSTVHDIVKQNGGSIRVNSSLGQGTSFEIYLPKATHVAECSNSNLRVS